jgi:hypothetical protein
MGRKDSGLKRNKMEPGLKNFQVKIKWGFDFQVVIYMTGIS